MKKLFKLSGIIAIAAIIGFSIAACANSANSDNSNNSNNSNNYNDDYDYTTIPQIPPAPKGPLASEPFGDINAVQLVADIKVGWNLGNTLDAHNITWYGPNPTVSQLETGWSNPVTTKENITAIKNAGFNAIRIPVSWTKCADPKYNIRVDWMERVTEVVNYAVDNDMYILLNTHHDEGVFKFTNAKKAVSINAFRGKYGDRSPVIFKITTKNLFLKH